MQPFFFGSYRAKQVYVSPSDTIMSPCTAKLSAYKSKQFGKYVFPSFPILPPPPGAFFYTPPYSTQSNSIQYNPMRETKRLILLEHRAKPQSLFAKMEASKNNAEAAAGKDKDAGP